MKVILTAIAGPHAGLTFEVPDGKFMRVGRAANADQSFPQDDSISGLHVIIDRSKPDVRLGDLKSCNGTFVNGEQVTTAVLKNGDELRIGGTILEVFVSSTIPAASGPDKQPLPDLLRKSSGQLYLLLDAAQGPQVRDLMRNGSAPYESLYDGESKTKLEDVAPYLLQMSNEPGLLGQLTAPGWWGKDFSLYLQSADNLAEVRRHLRRFLTVKNAAGEQLYFRFYDPRVLPSYLSTCTPQERQMFFGPVSQYWIETTSRPILQSIKPVLKVTLD